VSTPSTEALDEVVAATQDARTLRVFVTTLPSLRYSPMIDLVPEAIRQGVGRHHALPDGTRSEG
jgi:hypothetical protein